VIYFGVQRAQNRDEGQAAYIALGIAVNGPMTSWE
jgi:hypothetical protein